MSGPERLLKHRRMAKGKKVFIFSDRSGMPIKLSNATVEEGTDLIVDKTESDGKWNRVAMNQRPEVPADAQELEFNRPGPLNTYFDT